MAAHGKDHYKARQRNTEGYSTIPIGSTPKPDRIASVCLPIERRHKELIEAKNFRKDILMKDPRSVTAYYETLAQLKLAKLRLDEMIEILENALT